MFYLRKDSFFVYVLIFFLFVDSGCSKNQPSPISKKKNSSSNKKKLSLKKKGHWNTVKKINLKKMIPVIGTFFSQQKTNLGTQIAGRILHVFVDVGDRVKKKDKLIQLDDVFLQIELKQKEAQQDILKAKWKSLVEKIKTVHMEVKLAKIVMDNSEVQYKRMKNLWEVSNPSINQKLYDDALFAFQFNQSKLKISQSRVAEIELKQKELLCQIKQAQQDIEYTQARLRETIIRAPYDGVITKKMVQVGEPVTVTPIIYLLEIQEFKSLELEFSLPQKYFFTVKSNTYIEFQVDKKESIKQKEMISRIYPIIDENTRSFRCRVLLKNLYKNKQYKFIPGLLVKVWVPIQELKGVLTVNKLALKKSKHGWKVSVLHDGNVSLRIVTIGLTVKDQVEVLKGLKEGEQVFLPE